MENRLVTDVREIVKFLNLQKQRLTGEAWERLRQTQYESILKRMCSSKLEWSVINTLSELFTQDPWSMSQQQDLSIALSQTSVGSTKPVAETCQTCSDFTPFWSVEDAQIMASVEPSLNTKLEQVACRMVPCQHWLVVIGW